MIASADVVVVGSGAFGASAAYHLARRGARVAVLERAALASQTSPRAAGLSSQVRATPALTRLAQRAVVKLAAFTDETGQPLRFTQSGALKIARTERDAEQLAREVARGAAAGVADRPRPGRRGAPAAADPRRARDRRRHVEPDRLQRRAVRAAARLLPGGREARRRAAAAHAGHRLRDRPAAAWRACGRRAAPSRRAPSWTRPAPGRAWSPTALGGALPVVPTRHQLLITEPIPGVGPEFPIARVIDANVYVRHERGGLMLGGYEPDPMQLDVAALPTSFDIAELPLDIEVLWRLARSVREQFPIFQDPAIRVAEHRGGLPTLTTDDRYLVGPLPGVAGAWVMSGCCVGGLSVSPALGEAMAEWILDGAPALDLAEISTARFAGRDLDEAELRERCRQAYATHYRA